MEQCELLVHISAPARIRDDKHYLSLAQSLIDFKAAAVTRITPSPDPPTGHYYDEGAAEQLVPCNAQRDDHNPPLQRPAQKLHQVSRLNAAASPADWPRRKPRSRIPSYDQRACNPPYRNPYHSHTAAPPKTRTPPQEVRPKTAPEQLESTVQVPRTDITKRRARSVSASFGSLSSWISDSQKSPTGYQGGSQGSSRFGIQDSFLGDSMDVNDSLSRSLSQNSLEDEPPRKKARVSSPAEAAPGPTAQGRPAGEKAYFLRDRSLDWTSSPSCSPASSTDSISSTATPSQQPTAPTQPAEVTSHPLARPTDADQVDISSASSSTNEAALTASHSNHVVEDFLSNNSTQHSDAVEVRKSGLRIGADLPLKVEPKEPAEGQVKFTSHITSWLDEFAKLLSFETLFRPVEVKRDVGVLERGYWQLDVTITDAEVVEAARRSPTKEEQMQAFRDRFEAETFVERHKKYDAAQQAGNLYEFDYGWEDAAVGLWTEEEFLEFWKQASSCIRDGKAGWATRMVREELVVEPSTPGVSRVRVRIFTWGEIIGHMYLALWILSNKATFQIPMEWIAADGTTVVKMAGTRIGRGKLGVWTRKGPAGVEGRWGVAEGGRHHSAAFIALSS